MSVVLVTTLVTTLVTALAIPGGPKSLFVQATHYFDYVPPAKRPRLEQKQALAAEPVPQLPFTAIPLIAQFLNPHELLTAAKVSRDWYSWYTSDQAWNHHDVYGVIGICNHYLKTSRTCAKQEWTCDPTKIKSDTANYYHLLLVFRQPQLSRKESRIWAPALRRAPLPFFHALCKPGPRDLGHLCFDDVPSAYLGNKELVYGLLRLGFDPKGLTKLYRNDRTAALAATHRECFDFGLADSSPFSPQLLEDEDVANHAVRRNGAAFEYLPPFKVPG